MKRSVLVFYWVATVILALLLLMGGVTEFMHPPDALAGMRRLGYSDYLMTILGCWKILGAIAILAPELPLVKEWAYAGIFFDLTGAAASHAFSADYGVYAFHVIVPLVLAGLAIASWAMRPPGRRLIRSAVAG